MAEEKKKAVKSTSKTSEKKTEAKVEAKTTTKSSSVSKDKKNSSCMLKVVLGLVVVQFLVIVFLGMSISNQKESIQEVSEKVSRLDSFFAANAPGYGDGNVAPSEPSTPEPAKKVELSQLNIEGEPTIGAADAPVVIVEYSDYECPFCQRFFSESYGKIKEEYIDTGKVKLVFKDFALSFHQLAKPASAAANCVQMELGNEKYFEMHDTIFKNQRSLTEANLKKWALELGASEDKFDACVTNEDVLAEIDADLAEGSQLGVTGTPSFFINGNLIVGAQPFAVLKQMIDTELENQ